VGNPATVKRKATEKRRKKYEARLGPGVYLPKAEREKVNAAVEQHLAEKKKSSEAAKKARAEKKKAAAAAAAEKK
jgi:DNA-binding helix-hairpin-helix protein with protein kinase domain